MAAKTCLVYGGAGQLGETVVNSFNTKGWNTISVDFRANNSATSTIVINGSEVSEHVNTVVAKLKGEGGSGATKLDAVICVAGGWCGGDIKSDNIFAGVEKMWNFNVLSSVAAGHIAANFLNENGFVIMTGAKAAVAPTPQMIAYGITKAATHHLVKSLAAPHSGLPHGTEVVAACPICLDTVTNRKGMPKANFDDWTPLAELSDKFVSWANGVDRPPNGSLVEVVTNNKVTKYNII